MRILLSFWAPIVVHRTQLTLLINSFHLPVKDQVYYLTHLFFFTNFKCHFTHFYQFCHEQVPFCVPLDSSGESKWHKEHFSRMNIYWGCSVWNLKYTGCFQTAEVLIRGGIFLFSLWTVYWWITFYSTLQVLLFCFSFASTL